MADQLQEVGEPCLLKYFLDGSRYVFKVDDIAYNKQVFPVVAGQIDIYYSYVGIVDIPTDEEMREMEREYGKRTKRQTA